jgi:hypothetical protein
MDPVIKKEEREEFEKLARPLIKFLCENFHPHVQAIITPGSCEITESLMRIPVEDYIPD